MIKKNFEIERNKTWDSFVQNSFEHFQDLASKIAFHPDVADDVKKSFNVVKKLIVYSYSEYDFLDVAFERALSIFELALHKRHIEIEQIDPGEKKLGQLINWASSKGLFELSKERIDTIRNLRNNFLGHKKSYSLFGIPAISEIFFIVDVINGLYEDIELRKERKRKLRSVNRELNAICEKGAIITLNQKKLIIFRSQLLFFNNYKIPHKYHFLFYPIFDPTEEENKVQIPQPILIEGKNWKVHEKIFIIESFDKAKVEISQIKRPVNIEKYRKWERKMEASSFPLKTIIEMGINKNQYNLSERNYQS